MSEENSLQTSRNRYKILDKLGEGGMGAVYRAVDRLNQVYVALKEVHLPPEQLDFGRTRAKDINQTSSELALANEFQVLASLRHPNIISVLDYGFDDRGQPFFTMDLLDKPQLLTVAAESQPYEIKLRLIMQVLQALIYLHRRQIIHRDLKPENILVDQDGIVKVLDFGLAIDREYAKSGGDSGKLAGTLAYIAPEVLTGTPPSVESDLYSMGLIIHQLVTGNYLFNISTVTRLIYDIVNTEPDLDDVPDELKLILERLLSKEPKDRYNDAEQLLIAICDATGLEHPSETLMIRESFLQASSLIGRNEELEQLENLIVSLGKDKGSLTLIAGESGVGKSRLLAEARTRALINRVLVTRGQAVSEGGAPYQLWHDILQWFSVLHQVDGTVASVLSDIIPNLSQILGRNIAKPAEVSPSAAQERLTTTIVNLLKRQIIPTVIILEDLHWAGQESLELLKVVSEELSSMSILILGSYRNDETPNLPESFLQASHIVLERLNREQITDLSRSILGELDNEPQIVAMLEGETAGNVFFVIEIIRALAEEAGGLRQIAEHPLPDNIVAGGILAILQRRIQRVPAEYAPLLRLAALVGRELDLNLLRKLVPNVDIEAFTLICSQVAVIEVIDEHWHFSHDKLREEIVRELKSDTNNIRGLHQEIATVIEEIYPDDESHISKLAYHWSEADVASKAAIYLEKASEQMNFWAYDKAIEYMKKSISYDDRLGELDKHRYLMRYSILAGAYQGLGQNNLALEYYGKFLKHLNSSPIPEANSRAIVRLLKEIGVQTRNRMFSSRFLEKKDGSYFNLHIYYSLINLPSVYIYTGDILRALIATLVGLNIIEVLKLDDEIGPTLQYAILAYIAGLSGIKSVAQRYADLTLANIPQASPVIAAQSRSLLGFFDLQNGLLESAEKSTIDVIKVFDEVGEVHSWTETLHTLSHIYLHRGKWQESLEVAKQGYSSARVRDDKTIRFYLHQTIIHILLHTHQLDVSEFDDYSLMLDTEAAHQIFEVPFEENKAHGAYYYTMRGQVQAHLGDYSGAFKSAKQAFDYLKGEQLQRAVGFFTFYVGLSNLCETLLREGSEALSSEETSQAKAFFQEALKLLKQFANLFQVAQPRFAFFEGWLAYHQQDTVKAQQSWELALNQAQKLGQPYEEALARFSLVQSPNVDVMQRQEHADTAYAQLEKLGARYAIARFSTLEEE
jgi:serine/threonine protein kinase/tetratricopeptide (TPR) repeat protein